MWSHLTKVSLISALLIFGAMSSTVAAQDTSAPLDTVRLRSGGFVRGRIIEYLPDDHVSLELPSGELRRFEMADVERVEEGARPEAPTEPTVPTVPTEAAAPNEAVVPPAPPEPPPEPPARAEPPAPAEPPALSLRLEGARADLTVHRRTGFDGGRPQYEPLCAPPCEVAVQPGEQFYAVSVGAGEPLSVGQGIAIDGPASLRAGVVDRSDIRIAGWSLLIGGGIAGGVVSAVGFTFQDNWTESGRFAMGFSGAAFAIVTIATGVILATQGDEAQLERLSRGEAALVRW